MSNLTAMIEPRHIPALARFLRSEGYTVSEDALKRDAFLLNHAERLETSDPDKQRKLLANMIEVRDSYKLF